MIVNVSRLRPFFGSFEDDYDFPSLRGGRGVDEEVNENIISSHITHTRSTEVLPPTRAHSLSKSDRPESVGLSAHTRARVRVQQEQLQDRPSLIQVRTDSNKKGLADQNITAVSSQQQKKERLIKRFLDEHRDPFQYSDGCAADPLVEAQAGLDGNVGGQQQHLYNDFLQWMRDFSEEEEGDDNAAKDDDYDLEVSWNADAEDNWTEGTDGWKSWTPEAGADRPGRAGLPGVQERTERPDDPAGPVERSDSGGDVNGDPYIENEDVDLAAATN